MEWLVIIVCLSADCHRINIPMLPYHCGSIGESYMAGYLDRNEHQGARVATWYCEPNGVGS